MLKKVGGSFSEWRDILARIFRLGSAFSREVALTFLLCRLNPKELCEDRDFVLWDRVCRTLSNNKRMVGLEVFLNWANILSQWSQCSMQPDLARLRREAAVQCYDQILQDDEASSRQKAKALVDRGVMHAKAGDVGQAIADFTAVLQVPDAPAEQKTLALVNRGLMHEEKGDAEEAIADYSAVIEMPDAPTEQKAKALIIRGGMYGERGDAKLAIDDSTAVIQMPDASAEQKTEALVARGWCYFLAGQIPEAIKDEEHAVSLDAANWLAHANLAVALLADGQTDAALMAYDGALALAAAEDLGEITADLGIVLEKYGPIPAADQVRDRIETRRKSLERGAAVQA
jgi:tetratricopeptide (TPR) repeat protein